MRRGFTTEPVRFASPEVHHTLRIEGGMCATEIIQSGWKSDSDNLRASRNSRLT
ncbi:hypothetical protein FA13DRAFT_1731636 [Coprinellus micaceus]|uniref:Uncharacterized protein n=1 Tax=Coprinellus micaceus TaxID=71717 RepID=A0A4Y7TES3_COPMI|nr:hypothetical protein FA13DRAFT_1731636 [Coprinellus micaceus]